MAQGRRHRTKREVIVKRRRTPFESFEALADACLPTLTARLWATCCWSQTMGQGWKIGDFNYLVVAVRPDPESSLYVQFLSEPHEVVLVEVCSGEWNPGAVKYVWKRQRERLVALGYAIGGRARNFQKEVTIETPAEAEAVASETLQLFYELFGYRGQWPLEIEWHRGERAEHHAVHSSVTPEDFGKLAIHLGFDAEVQAGPPPVVGLRHGKKICLAGLAGRIPDRNLYAGVQLETLVTSPRAIDEATVDRIGQALEFARVVRRGDRALILTMRLRFDGGVTVDWMANALQHWLESWRACERLLRAARPPLALVPKARRQRDVRVH